MEECLIGYTSERQIERAVLYCGKRLKGTRINDLSFHKNKKICY